MAIRLLTDATGRKMAEVLEAISTIDRNNDKFPELNFFDFWNLTMAAANAGHSAITEISAMPYASTTSNNSPLLNFLQGMNILSNFEISDGGRLAYVSYDYMKYLLFEASRFNQNNLVKMKNGIVSRIGTCPVREIYNENLPSGFAFMILGSDVVRGLKELESQGKLDDTEALAALVEANPDGIYVHYGQPWLKTLSVDVAPAAGGKMKIKINNPKEKSTNKWYYITYDPDVSPVPTVTYGTSIDPTSETWRSAVELVNAADPDQTEFEITPAAGKPEILIVELLRSMKPIGYRIKSVVTGT